ncbi:MAG: ATP-binding protein [Pseudomonadota bacterium]
MTTTVPRHVRGHFLFPLMIVIGGIALLFGVLMLTRTDTLDVREYTRAEFIAETSVNPPSVDDARWQALTLPDAWWQREVMVDGGWYRLQISEKQIPEDLQGIYLFRLNMNAAVYFNGVLLGNGGHMDVPFTRNWNRPLYFNIPRTLWRVGNNELLVNLRAYPAFGMLAPPQIGADAVLKPRYQWRQFLQNEMSLGFTLMLALVGFYMLGLWLKRRDDSAYLWFALSCFSWAAFNTHLFLRDPPVQGGLFLWFAHITLDFWMVFLVGFMHRYLGLQRRRLEQSLIAIQTGLGLIFIYPMITYAPDFVSHASTTHAITFACGVYLMVLAWKHWHTERGSHAGGLAAVFTLFVLAGLHDLLMENPIPGLLSWELLTSMWRNQFHFLFLMVPLLLLFVSWHLTQRFVLALNEAENLNRELEERVAAAQRELSASFEARRTLELDQVTVDERERIYRDLHDDVGAKLLGLAISAQRANLLREADLARSALQDLRDVVSRSAQLSTPLGHLLADLRAETEQRVQAAGLTLIWHFPEEDGVPQVGADAALNLSRILREAVSNVLRHANASEIEVIIRLSAERFVLDVIDNGVGCPIADVKPHRGMTGMQVRAAALGGTLVWGEIAPNGCKVTLDIPLAGLTPETRG